nr:triple QxxK/R motif-containing protein isoform X3 [Equus asinus]
MCSLLVPPLTLSDRTADGNISSRTRSLSALVLAELSKKKQPRILLLVSGVEFARNVSNRFLGKDLAFGNILPLGSSSEFRLGSIKNTIQGYMSKMGW